MDRYAWTAAMEHVNRMKELMPHFGGAMEMMRAAEQDRRALAEALVPEALKAARDAEYRLQELDSAQVRAIRDLMHSLTHLTEQSRAMQDFFDSLQEARAHLDVGAAGYLRYARESLDAFLDSVYAPPAELLRDPARWLDEEIDRVLADKPEYRRSRLAWILVIFVPRFRLALYEQDGEGDFDGVMKALWEDLLGDPEVRARLRERLEKSGAREELRRSLSSHLDKLEAGELMYAIMGLYAHIEGFLAELAVERGLIPDKEGVLRPNGTRQQRRGVSELIKVLHENGQIDDSQEKFLTFVLSNSYQANRVRHGTSFEYTQERATALVLALILILCLSWGMEAGELLDADASSETEAEDWIDEILEEDRDEPEVSEDVARFIDEILEDEDGPEIQASSS